MKLKNKINGSICLILCLLLSSCLKTRAEVGEDEQSQVYNKKLASNHATQQESQLNQKSSSGAQVNNNDDHDDIIRTLNGRIESLENQVATVTKENSVLTSQNNQKIIMLQEAITKMEAQMQKMEAEQLTKKAAAEAVAVAAAAEKAEEPVVVTHGKTNKKNSKNEKLSEKSSDKNASPYETAQGFFANKDWKKAILNYQKYVDNFPKGKEIADSKYKIGVCFQELGMKEESMAFFEEVVANYAKTDSGKKAKIRLAKLKNK